MIPIKNNQDVSFLLGDALRNNSIGDLDRMALDLRSLNGASKEAKIKRIAIQFEQILINTLLKSAFKEEKDPENQEGIGLTFGPVNDLKAMLLSQHISDNGGLGYQEVIERQIREKYFDGSPPSGAKALSAPSSIPVLNHSSTNPPAKVTSGDDKELSSHSHLPGIDDPGKIVQPVVSEISSTFGWRRDPIDGKTRFHNGIDFDVPPNSPIKSFMAGEVVFSGWEKGYGYLVEIKHADGYTSRYGHNSRLLVKEGDKVEAGTMIALSGSTGRSTGPHLHFEIRKGDLALNPAGFLKQNNINVFAKKSEI